MNPFEVLASVQEDYLTYVRTFQRFQNPEIRDWVMDRIKHGTLLWKPPFIQLSRPFAQGDTLGVLVEEGLLHPNTPPIFCADPNDAGSPPVRLYKHQSDAIRAILGSPPRVGEGPGVGVKVGANTVVATGTGSGKSFAFGIPIVSEALHMRDEGVNGIKAVLVYPMNALANSQYDDFARRLHGSGLTIARYTGDTATRPEEALERYQRATGRDRPYDSEVLSRDEIQNDLPDILMTNYVMLELLLTRFEDRKLFAQPGVLRFLVLDEVHTYTGKRGADVAALIRRLKQHTRTVGRLRCIATSATVEAPGGDADDVGAVAAAAEAVAGFARRLFGEPFSADRVIAESYAPLPQGNSLPPLTREIADCLADGPLTVHQIAEDLGATLEDVQSALLPSTPDSLLPTSYSLFPKLHAFFSQGRAIAACIDPAGPHLNDRGERVCPVCAQAGRERATFPLVFCRACGQEVWSVAIDEAGRIHPAELGQIDVSGRPGYLLPGHLAIELPDQWLTSTGKVRGGKSGYQDVVPEPGYVCPDCGKFITGTSARPTSACSHPHRFAVTFLPAPFLLCPTCGIVHDRRSREYNKLFTFGSVGRSTATDVLVNAQVQSLPEDANKIIAFSDNRQDTALQAAHMNSLHRRFTFRQTLYTGLLEEDHLAGEGEGLPLRDVGSLLFDIQKNHDVLPNFRESRRIFGRDLQAEDRYRRYLEFVTLWELGATHRRTHQNLEDVGLMLVGYYGLDECAAADEFWTDVPYVADLDVDVRYDLLLGLMDLMRKRLAIPHDAIMEPGKFERDVTAKLNEEAYVHDATFTGPVGYSDTAEYGYGYTLYRLTGTNTQPVAWVKRVFEALERPLDHADAVDLVIQVVERLGDPRAEFLLERPVQGYRKKRYHLWMVNPTVITLWADRGTAPYRCPRCGTVHHFRALRVCTGTTCRTTLEARDLTGNYFRQVYATPLGQAVPVRAEEHSGQVSGEERREIELRFRDEENPLNVLVCTPTMELGIDIGHLNAVTLRNVPPSPSNYAQRAGRAGRSGQPALITVFAGVGASRGPHDQYFYRFPEKMIAGAIAAPRFRLNNRAILSAHIHALVLETMGLMASGKLPTKPRDLLDLAGERFPIYPDWRTAYQAGIDHHFESIVAAVEEAFTREMKRFAWLDRAFIETQVRGFLTALDRAMDRWRDEYRRLDAEREAINRKLGQEGVDPNLNRRRVVIEAKLDAMRDGKRDWYLYRYLGGEGFLPGYAFPPQATALAFDDREDEMARDPDIALTEYAPGNFIYYRGERYEVTHARPSRRRVEGPTGPTSEPETELDVERVLVCPACQRAYVGQEETNRAACACGQELIGRHPRQGMALTDMYAQRRARITADEEERLRLGYEITPHYRAGGQQRVYRIRAGGGNGKAAFTLTLEHGGEVLRINRGQRQQEDDPQGFTLCQKCHRWLIGKDMPEKHVYTPDKQGQCPRNAHPGDLKRNLWLTTTIQSDLALFDVPLPADVAEDEAEAFYTTLSHTLVRALMVAFNLDEREVNSFLAPAPDADNTPYRVVLYETTVGGSGVLASLAEPGRLATVVERARELLHEGDPEGGCQKACYACLLSFYNQRAHALLDRTLVLSWLQGLEGADNKHPLTVEPVVSEGRFEELAEQCQSDLEQEVLRAIRDRGLPLPEAAQETIYDEGEPLAIADFFYAPRIAVFVDGSPHHRDYVQAADRRKRMRMKALGYRVVVVRAAEPSAGLDELAARLG